ncbi:dihydrolipoyl dehydrogenase family protein [Oenococcus sp.]|uniref:dihydrolipoyl dehydrogenase family protein n=1 Tax=Oenococcus sp. TaxID=1979414 RepID=UPI0039EC2FDC
MPEKQFDYDVLYIGSGHGTFDGAIPLAAKGYKVAVVEADLIGGTCPNRGCNAKIILDMPVALRRQFEDLNGVVTGGVAIDWSQNVAHKDEVIGVLPGFIGGLLDSVHIDVIHGKGVLEDPHTVSIDGTLKTAGKIVIATGLRPNRLDIPGIDLAHDSSDFMNLTKMPKKITIIGGGYIAMEFATIANATGADVTVLLRGDKALRAFHQEFVETIISDLEKHGVTFKREISVTELKAAGDQIQVLTADGQSSTTDWVLDATGRIPNVENIGLEKVGVHYTAKGVTVNDHLQTSVPSIYASGDVIDKAQPKLTPTAIFESKYLSAQFAGESSDPIKYPVIPSVVFTTPRLAKAGVSPETAAAAPSDYTVSANHTPNDWYRQASKETLGDNLLVFDKAHHLVGATEVSNQAENVINSLLPAIEFKFGPAELNRLVYLFPSITSAAYGQL